MSEEIHGGPPPGVPQPLSIPADALRAIVAGNRAALGLPPQEDANAHECTRHCGPGYHPDRVTVGLIEAHERDSSPGIIHHAKAVTVSAREGAAPGQAALSPAAYAAYEAYVMAAPDDLNFREPDKLDDWEYPAWEAAAQAGYEHHDVTAAAAEQPGSLVAVVRAHRDALAEALARIEHRTEGYDPGTNEHDVHEIASAALATRDGAAAAQAAPRLPAISPCTCGHPLYQHGDSATGARGHCTLCTPGGCPAFQQPGLREARQAAEAQPAPGESLRDRIHLLASQWESNGARHSMLTDAEKAVANRYSADLRTVLKADRAEAQPAPGLRADAETAELLRADLADAEAQLARWPRCPSGCNCRIGVDTDPDANECGCDGPCNGGGQPAPGGLRDLAAEVIRAYAELCQYDETERDRKRLEGWRARLSAGRPAPGEVACEWCTHPKRKHETGNGRCFGRHDDASACKCTSFAPVREQPAPGEALQRTYRQAAEAERDRLRDGIKHEIEQLEQSAAATMPSKKSAVEAGLAERLATWLEGP